MQSRLQQNNASLKGSLSSNTAFTVETQMKVHFAAWTGDKESAEMLVRQGEDITVPDSYGWTALHLAVWNMHADMVIFLLEVVDQMMWISTQNQDGISALHLATCNN